MTNSLKQIKVSSSEAGGRVQVNIEKSSQFVSQITKLYIDKDLIKNEPDKISMYVQNVVNDALKKEFQEMLNLSQTVMKENPGNNNNLEKMWSK